MNGRLWSNGQDDVLIKHVRSGYSCGEISTKSPDIFGVYLSRGAISGRILRLRTLYGDNTFRAGLTAGRNGNGHEGGNRTGLTKNDPVWIARRAKRIARRAKRTRERWERWAKLNGCRQSARPANGLPVKRRRRFPVPAEMMNHYGVVCCEAVTIHQLRGEMCHWPLWQQNDALDFDEIKYCGNACEGVYCAAHHSLGRQAAGQRTPERKRMAARAHQRFLNGGTAHGRAA